MIKEFNCLYCGKLKTFRPKQSTGKYCSNACQQAYQYDRRIEKWKAGEEIYEDTIKKYLADKKEGCYTCGLTEWRGKPITLELEHIDGNSSNNKEENLELICPNCHSQTDTYKGKNKGKGRHSRRLRYAEGKSY